MKFPGLECWPEWQKVLFRFFFCYLLLYIQPWLWIEYIPGADILTNWYYELMDQAVHAVNRYIFHSYKELVPPNGSGDTSYNWTQVWLLLWLAFIICVIWSLLDRRRRNYNLFSYWLRIFVRYFVIINCFGYGIIKLFALQMLFPNLSQLATPLGDFLPMRLSWMFMGYSTTYQQFSGLMELIAGVLMLFRKTSTFGTLLAAGVFGNVFMMNISYDIPVKLFSLHLFLMCVFLLAFEIKRIAAFFLFNKPTNSTEIYKVEFPHRWMRITRIVLKAAFVLVVVILPFINNRERYVSLQNQQEIKPIKPGMYDVTVFIVNNDTVPALLTDSIRWRDVIFEKGGQGSVNTTDTVFRQRYRRGYFNYAVDSSNNLVFSKTNVMNQRTDLFTMNFELPDSNSIVLRGKIKSDSIVAVLKKNNRHFQLAERQFHWLSEYNR